MHGRLRSPRGTRGTFKPLDGIQILVSGVVQYSHGYASRAGHSRVMLSGGMSLQTLRFLALYGNGGKYTGTGYLDQWARSL